MDSQSTNIPEVGPTIRTLRTRQNLSLAELAARCGVSKSMISQIESGKTNPTLAMIWKIARGLGADIQMLLNLPGTYPGADEQTSKTARQDPPPPGEDLPKRFMHFQSDGFTQLQADKPGIHFSVLTPLEQAEDLEIYMITLQPGSRLQSHPHLPGTEEYLTLLEGQLEVGTPERSARLKSGDFILYQADGPHFMHNTAQSPAVVHLVVRFRSAKPRHRRKPADPIGSANPDREHPKAAVYGG
ncbi:helix-turn-helix domain-containing protein [Spirochaeta lutea]|uniref:helix-turn-helix domain-containing protein n=1 Tax=Spirochaeta lutea TaxID=1480694 RepID=UPI00068DB3CE|nr:XRE family transcriptional regulator [Spirochaeta lutea]